MENLNTEAISLELIQSKIYIVRGVKVMLDRDLAVLYGVTTKVLNQAVKRNSERFPEDFMFELSLSEAESLRSQFVTLKRGQHRKYSTFAFTEQGVAMLSSVLKSSRAALVNIQIIRTFVHLRQLLAEHADLQLRLDDLELRYDKQFKIVFDAMRQVLAEDSTEKPEIGFRSSFSDA
ncbi:ORF6N domain-containing protein [Patescibacteria group bacterium]|nr:ORF6N domain-containing protein [Patescibacteria group bacterium]